jgi:hypothetical protein
MILPPLPVLEDLYWDFVAGTLTINGGTPITSAGFQQVNKVLGTATLTASGCGIDTATSIVVLTSQGFANFRATATMFYPLEAAGSESFGIVGRAGGWGDGPSRNYIYARQFSGNARIYEVAADTIAASPLASAAFALNPNVDVTIMLQVVGTVVTSSWTASGVTTQTPGGTTTITGPGSIGIRTGPTKSGRCKNFRVQRLP